MSSMACKYSCGSRGRAFGAVTDMNGGIVTAVSSSPMKFLPTTMMVMELMPVELHFAMLT
jgi:hypothetical protein